MFTSVDLLAALDEGKENVARKPGQDLESFLWVLLYVVFKNALDESSLETAGFDAETRIGLQEDFDTLFTATGTGELFKNRFLWVEIESKETIISYAKQRSTPGHRFDRLIYAVLQALHKAAQWGTIPRREDCNPDGRAPPTESPLTYEYILEYVFGRFWSME